MTPFQRVAMVSLLRGRAYTLRMLALTCYTARATWKLTYAAERCERRAAKLESE